MNVYKISEINETILETKLKFGNPELNVNYYLINCETDLFIQIDEVEFKNNFYKQDEKIFINIHIKQDLEKYMLVCDNFIINIVNNMFPLWFDKEIDMGDLLEYYIPTTQDYYEHIKNDDQSSDFFSYTSSEENEDDNDETLNDNNYENNENNDLFISCEVPYDYEENDLDIMIYNSENNTIDHLWNEIDIMGKKGKCIIKLSGLKIEKNKFSSVWELIQLKIY